MKILSGALAGGLAVGLVVCGAGCTNTPADSSSSSSSGGGGSSSSSTTGGTSQAMGSSNAGSGGATSSNGGTSQAGGSSGVVNSSSRPAGSSSGGTTCPLPPFTLCDGIPAEATARTITTTGTLGITNLVTVGMTRQAVRAAFGTDQEQLLPGANGGPSPFPLRVFYCAKRLSISYADQPNGSGTLDGALSDDDVVTRIVTLDGFAGATDTGIAHGDSVGEVETAYGTTGRAQTLSTQLGGSQDLYPARGLAFGNDGAVVKFMAVHNAYTGTVTPTVANVSMSLANLRLSSGATEVKAAASGGTNFAAVKQRLGTPDTEGFATVSNQDIAYLSYGSAGIRVVGLKDSGVTMVDQVNTFQIYLTPPFAGFDGATTLGLGAPKSEWDTAFSGMGSSTTEGVTFYRYRVATQGILPVCVGVAYAQDEACVERAAVVALNFLCF